MLRPLMRPAMSAVTAVSSAVAASDVPVAATAACTPPTQCHWRAAAPFCVTPLWRSPKKAEAAMKKNPNSQRQRAKAHTLKRHRQKHRATVSPVIEVRHFLRYVAQYANRRLSKEALKYLMDTASPASTTGGPHRSVAIMLSELPDDAVNDDNNTSSHQSSPQMDQVMASIPALETVPVGGGASVARTGISLTGNSSHPAAQHGAPVSSNIVAEADDSFADLLSESDLSTVAVPSVPVQRSPVRSLTRPPSRPSPSPPQSAAPIVPINARSDDNANTVHALLRDVEAALQATLTLPFVGDGNEQRHVTSVQVTCEFSSSNDQVEYEGHLLRGGGREGIAKDDHVMVATVVITITTQSSVPPGTPGTSDNTAPLLQHIGGEGIGVSDIEAALDAIMDACVDGNLLVPDCVHAMRLRLSAEQQRDDSDRARSGSPSPQYLSHLQRSIAGRLWRALTVALSAAPRVGDDGATVLSHAMLCVSDTPSPSASNETVPVAVAPGAAAAFLQIYATNHEDASLVSSKQLIVSFPVTKSPPHEPNPVYPALPMEYLRCLDLAVQAISGTSHGSSSPQTNSDAPRPTTLSNLLCDMPCVIPVASRTNLHSVSKCISRHYLGNMRSFIHRHDAALHGASRTTTLLWLPFNAASLSLRVKLDAAGKHGKRGDGAGVLGYHLPVACGAPARTNDDARELSLHKLLCMPPDGVYHPVASAAVEDVASGGAASAFPFPLELHGQLSSPHYFHRGAVATTSSTAPITTGILQIGVSPPFERGTIAQLKWLAHACGQEFRMDSVKLQHKEKRNVFVWETCVYMRPVDPSTHGVPPREEEEVSQRQQQWILRVSVRDFKRSHSVSRATMQMFDDPPFRAKMEDSLYERFLKDAAPIIAAYAQSLQKSVLDEADHCAWIVCRDASTKLDQQDPLHDERPNPQGGVSAATCIRELEAVTSEVTAVPDIRRGPSLYKTMLNSINDAVEDPDFIKIVAATLGLDGGPKTSYNLRLRHSATSNNGSAQYELRLAATPCETSNPPLSASVTEVSLCSFMVVEEILQQRGPPSCSLPSWQIEDMATMFAWWVATFPETKDDLAPYMAPSSGATSTGDLATHPGEGGAAAIREAFWSRVRTSAIDMAAFCLLPTPDKKRVAANNAICEGLIVSREGLSSLTREGERAHPLEILAITAIRTLGWLVAVSSQVQQVSAEDIDVASAPTSRHVFTISIAPSSSVLPSFAADASSSPTWHPVVAATGPTMTAAGLAACKAFLTAFVFPLTSTCALSSAATESLATSSISSPGSSAPRISEASESLILVLPLLEPNSIGGQLITTLLNALTAALKQHRQAHDGGTPTTTQDDIVSIDSVRFGALYSPSSTESKSAFVPIVEVEYSLSTVVTGGGPRKTVQIACRDDACRSAAVFSAIGQLWGELADGAQSGDATTAEMTPNNKWFVVFPVSNVVGAHSHATSSADATILDLWQSTVPTMATNCSRIVTSFRQPRVLQQTIPGHLLDIYTRKYFGAPVQTMSEVVPRTTDWRTELSVEVFVRRPPNALRDSHVSDSDDVEGGSPQRCQLILSAALGMSKKLSYKICAVPLLRHELIDAAHTLQNRLVGRGSCSSVGAAVSPVSGFWDLEHFSMPAEGRNTTSELTVRVLTR